MILQVQKILNSKYIDIDEEIDKIPLPEGMKTVGVINFRARISHGENYEIHMIGHLKAKVCIKCVVCLEDFEEDLDIDFNETYVPNNNDSPPGVERPIEELDIFIYKDGYLDTDEIARDMLLGNISPYPTCTRCVST